MCKDGLKMNSYFCAFLYSFLLFVNLLFCIVCSSSKSHGRAAKELFIEAQRIANKMHELPSPVC